MKVTLPRNSSERIHHAGLVPLERDERFHDFMFAKFRVAAARQRLVPLGCGSSSIAARHYNRQAGISFQAAVPILNTVGDFCPAAPGEYSEIAGHVTLVSVANGTPTFRKPK